MTAILPSRSAMDPSTVFGYSSDTLSNLLPEPPSHPPPDSHGPPILSSNEVSQFNSHIEALTTAYKHTPDWKDPPRHNSRVNVNHNSVNSSSNSQLNSSLALANNVSVDDFVVYHGLYEGYQPLGALGATHWNEQFNVSPTGTIAPHQLHNGSTSTSHNTNTADVASMPLADGDPSTLNYSFNKGFYQSVLTASHNGYSAPFLPEGFATNDKDDPLPIAGYHGITSQQNRAFISHDSPVRNQHAMAYGSDPAWNSPHFAAPGDVANRRKTIEEKTLGDYGLEPEPSAAPTRRNTPDRELGSHQPTTSPRTERRSLSNIVSPEDSKLFFDKESGEPPKKRKRSTPKVEPLKSSHEIKAIPEVVPAVELLNGQKKNKPKSTNTDKKRRKKASPRPRLSESQKKENHKASEAKRRKRVDKAESRLWSLVPGMNQKASKRVRLDMTMDYMQTVKQGNELLGLQLQKLQRH